MAPPSAMAKKKTGKKKERNHQSSVSFFDDSFAVTELLLDEQPSNNKPGSSSSNSNTSPTPSSPIGTPRVANREKLTPTPGKALARIPRESLRNRMDSTHNEEAHALSPMRSPIRSSSPTNSQGSHATLQSNNNVNTSNNTKRNANGKPMPRIVTSTTTTTAAAATATTTKKSAPTRMSVMSTSPTPTGKAPNAPARKRVSNYLRPTEVAPLLGSKNSEPSSGVGEETTTIITRTIPSTSRTSLEPNNNNNNRNHTTTIASTNPRLSLQQLQQQHDTNSSKRNSTPTTQAAQGLVQKIQMILIDKNLENDADMMAESTDGDSTYVTNSVGTDSVKRSAIISLTTDDDDDDDEDDSFLAWRQQEAETNNAQQQLSQSSLQSNEPQKFISKLASTTSPRQSLVGTSVKVDKELSLANNKEERNQNSFQNSRRSSNHNSSNNNINIIHNDSRSSLFLAQEEPNQDSFPNSRRSSNHNSSNNISVNNDSRSSRVLAQEERNQNSFQNSRRSSNHNSSNNINVNNDSRSSRVLAEGERNQNSFQNSRRSSNHNSSNNINVNNDSRSSLVATPLIMLVEEGDEETGSAYVQEQAVRDGNKLQIDDGTASLRSGRSCHSSRSSHSSSAQNQSQKFSRSASLDNQSKSDSKTMALPQTGLIEAAELEKQQNQMDEGDDDDLLVMAFGTEARNRWEYWSPCILCTIMLGFWAGCIPYLVVRNDSLKNVPSWAPVGNMVPWTVAPTSTPTSPRPTVAPTTIHDNQDVLDLLGSDPEWNITDMPSTTAPTLGSTKAPTPAVISNTTDLTTAIPAPTLALNETTTAPEDPFNGTTLLPSNNTPTFRPSLPPSTRAPTTGLPSKSPTKSPTFAPSPSKPTTMSPTVSLLPSSMPSLAPTREEEIVFPEYTLAAFNNPASPQSKAFGWMLRDPNFGTYSSSRMRQRFALATLYYSTNGDDWWLANYTISQTTVRGGLLPWLSYLDHECDWFHQRTSDARETSDFQALFSYTSSSSGVVVCVDEIRPNGVFRGFRRLWLEGVGLQGTLPQELALLTDLEELHLSHNQVLVGPLPPEWFLNDKKTDQSWQSTLKKLKVQNCSLTGTIPSQISLASNLEILDLQQNAFVGSIPSELGLMSNLQDLLWNDNALTGEFV
jgi:hypothetical protein